jgi:hypothetical protein
MSAATKATSIMDVRMLIDDECGVGEVGCEVE